MPEQNQSSPPQELTADQRIAQLEQLVQQLSANQQTPATSAPAPAVPAEDGVYVKQWRNVDIDGDILQKDIVENQYYDAVTFAKLNEVVPGDEAKRTHFETLGIQYEITKDLRKSKKKA